jgi:glycogen debranching enzyme
VFPRTTSARLAEKRYVVSGDRAYLVGTADGRFPAMGWHIRGEMGGLWAPPIKLLDGYWFNLDGEPLPAANALHVHTGHVELEYPSVGGLELTRAEVAPDGIPAVLVGLTLTNAWRRPRVARVRAGFRSKLLASFPWNVKQRGQDSARLADGPTLVFEHGDWSALVSCAPSATASLAAAHDADVPALDGGAWGTLDWRLRLGPEEETTLWIAIAGSHSSQAEAESALALALANPPRHIARKAAARRRLLRQSRLAGTSNELGAAFDVAKLNLADLRRVVPGIHVRDARGSRLGKPVNGAVELRGLGAGYPDYAHFFAGDACYAAHGLVVSGQWETALEHLRLLREVSRAVNGETGKVVHEITFDGSVFYGTNEDPGNVDETPLVAVAAELLWRWSGDPRVPDELYDFVCDGMRYVVDTLDTDEDGYPAGEGGVERAGAGEETLVACIWTQQGLRALERLAHDRPDSVTAAWAAARAARIEESFDRDWWLPTEGLYADSLGTDNHPVLQRHWACALPMTVGLAPVEHAEAALRRLESLEFSGATGLFHTAGTDRRVWTVGNGVMAVAEANYGRLEQALRYMRAIAAATDLEMPGALPEVLPSPDYEPFGDLLDRLMFMQAWSAYGVQWPIVNNFLGIRPDAPARAVTVAPNLPPSLPRLGIRDLRIGDDVISVTARRTRDTLKFHVDAPHGWRVRELTRS